MMKFLVLSFFSIIILHSTLYAQIPKEGLKGEYFIGTEFQYPTFTRIDKNIGFSRRLKSPAPGIPEQFFSIRWTGRILAPETGLYTFHVLADDGVRLYVNHKLIIDAWFDQEATAYSGVIMLEKGNNYDIKIDYYNSIVHSVIDITWQIPEKHTRDFFDYRNLQPAKTPLSSNYLKPEPVKETIVTNLVLYDKEKQENALITTTGLKEAPYEKPVAPKKAGEVPVKKIKLPSEEPIVLKTVVFEQQRHEIPRVSFQELDLLSAYLKMHLDKKIEIHGHTDYAGDSVDNHILSEKRAMAVAEYLKKSGVAESRITYKGFGGSKPIVKSSFIEDRLMNRRVEFLLHD